MRYLLLLFLSINCSGQMIKNLPNSTSVDANTYFITQEYLGGSSWSLANKTVATQIASYIGTTSGVSSFNTRTGAVVLTIGDLNALLSGTSPISYSSGVISIGNIPVTKLNSGTSASSSTFWRGDGTWATPSGTTYAATSPITLTGSNFGFQSIAATSVPANTTGSSATPSGSLGYSITSSASTLVERDASQNAFANNFISKGTNTVSAGGTTILTAASARLQNLTGSSAQTYQLPDATTLSVGSVWYFNNNSSGLMTITNNGGSTITTVLSGAAVQVIAIAVVVSNGSWDYHFLMPSNSLFGTSGLSITNLNATGTPSSSNYLRGDGTWNTPSGTTYSAGTGLTLIGSTFSLTNPVAVNLGGTGLATLTAHNLMIGNGTSAVTFLAPSSSGLVPYSNGTDFVMSTPTLPLSSSATSGKIMKSDGTNWVASTATYASPGSLGNFYRSDGTNWTANTIQTTDIPDISQYTSTTTTSSPLAPTSTLGNRLSTVWYCYTAQATTTLTISDPTGSWVGGQIIIFRFRDAGSPVTITFGSNYITSGSVAPTLTTVSGKDFYYEFVYNATTSKWNLVGFAYA